MLTEARANFMSPITPGVDCVSFDQLQSMMLGHAFTGILVDIALLALPLWLLYSNMLWSRQTFQVMLVFGLGAFAFVTGIVRLSFMLQQSIITDP